jgi:hypothetical protein
LIDRRRHSGILDVRSFRGADCDTDYYFVVGKVRVRQVLRKRNVKKTDIDGFNFRKLKDFITVNTHHNK